MSHEYYTLIIRRDGRWSVEYGSFALKAVRDEMSFNRSVIGFAASSLAIIATAPDQGAIEFAVWEMNEAEAACGERVH